MAEKKRPKSFFDRFKFWKKKSSKRRSLPKPSSKEELGYVNRCASLPPELIRRDVKQDYRTNERNITNRPFSLDESAYYIDIPEAHFTAEEEKLRERNRITELLERQNIPDETLFVIPPRSLSSDRSRDGRSDVDNEKLRIPLPKLPYKDGPESGTKRAILPTGGREDYRTNESSVKYEPIWFGESAYYAEIPEEPCLTSGSKHIKDKFDHTYIVSVHGDGHAIVPEVETDIGISGDCRSEEGKLITRERERIIEILERQKISEKTLYENYDKPPEIPLRSPQVKIRDIAESQEVIGKTLNTCEEPTTMPPRNSNSFAGAASLPLDEKPDEYCGKGAQCVVDADTAKDGLSLRQTCTHVCVRGLAEITSLDTLCDFLEVKSGNTVDSDAMVQGESGIVVVPFTDEIDFHGLSEALKKRTLDNSFLEVCPIKKQVSVVVSSDEVLPSDEDLLHYCEKHLGGVVSCSNMDNGMKFVSFKNDIAVSELCATHRPVIKGKSFVISPLYECEFGKVWNKTLHINIP